MCATGATRLTLLAAGGGWGCSGRASGGYRRRRNMGGAIMRRIILRLVRRVRALGGERCDFCAIRMPRQASIVSVVEGARRVGVLCESCALDWLGEDLAGAIWRES